MIYSGNQMKVSFLYPISNDGCEDEITATVSPVWCDDWRENTQLHSNSIIDEIRVNGNLLVNADKELMEQIEKIIWQKVA